MKIPNWLTIGVFPFILAYKFYIGSWTFLGDSLLAYLAVILFLFLPFVLKGLGAGDLKFIANIGAFVGLKSIVPCFILGVLCSIPVVIYYSVKYRERILYFIQHRQIADMDIAKLPYTPPFAIGTIIYLSNPEFISFLFR